MRILYFDIDSLRPDHLGCYGYKRPTSPAIDRIAAEGRRFEHYYCASSPCMPSRTSLYSGRFGIRNGVIAHHGAGNDFHIEQNKYGGPEQDNDMFPRQLMRHGMDTYCFSNFADRHCALWFMYGWSEFHLVNLKGGQETAEEVNAKVLPWLKNHAGRDNYFLHINYWDAHRCYKMDSSWAEPMKDFPVENSWPDNDAIAGHQQYTGPFTARSQFVYSNGKSPWPLMPGSVSNREDYEKMVTGYDTAISYIDSHIQEIIDELERQNLMDDTAIIISGDHGDAFGEHGIYSDHVCADECIHRVPLIVRWPGVAPENTVDDAFMYNLDLAPTICDLMEIPAPPDWDGKSYKSNFRGDSTAEDRDYLVWDTGLYTVQRAVRTKTHLYIRTYDQGAFSHFEPEELYDMIRDPFQTENLIGDQPEIARDCREKMQRWVEEQKHKPDWHGDPLEKIVSERNEAAATPDGK